MNLLSIIIAVLLLAAVLRGRYLGFVRSLLSLGGRFVVYAVAVLMSHRLGSWIHETFLMTVQARWAANGVPEFVSDKANEFLASGLAFGLIMIIGTFIVSSIERSLRFINHVPLLGTVNRLAGMLVYGLLVYVEIFFVLQLTQTWEIPWYHDAMIQSPIAQWILNQTPYFSDAIYQWWILQ